MYEKIIKEHSNINTNDNGDKILRAKNILLQIIKNDISSRQKQVLLLYFFHKKNMPQIAAELTINKSTVSRTISRALKNIDNKMKYYDFR